MTHPDTAKMINDQIAKEFEKLNDFMTFKSEKPVIMDRIRELKAMLDDEENVRVVEPTIEPMAMVRNVISAIRAHRCPQ